MIIMMTVEAFLLRCIAVDGKCRLQAVRNTSG